MGFFSKLLGLGVAAGAAMAAIKVAQKYEENKADEAIAAEAEGQEVPEKETSAVISDVAKAAGDVFSDYSVKVKDAMSGVKDKIQSAKESDIAVEIKEGIDEAKDVVTEKFTDAKEAVTDKINEIKDDIEDAVTDAEVKDDIEESIEEDKTEE